MIPKQWVDATLGKYIDTDNYPRENPYQCWDYFDFFCRKIGFTGSRKCANTGYVGDLWILRDVEGYHYYTDFDYITDPKKFEDGDWVFWEKHVALFMSPNSEVGQNQNGIPYVTEKSMNWNGILGAMRYKHWQSITVPHVRSVITINGHQYAMARMMAGDEIGVFSNGLNTVSDIHDFDAENILVSAKITGANYHQMKDSEPDPYGTTYGDISAPLNGVYQSLPNQSTTLFYDMETGRFGDCTGVVIDSSHNVFSPSLVYPNSKGHWEYAEMVGLGHKDLKSWYTFVVRFNDGYATGLARQEMTPQEIADDFKETEMINIAFLDGGGSAEALFWNNETNTMDEERYTGRKTASSINIFRRMKDVEHPAETPEIQPEIPPASDETGKEEEIPMEPEIKPIPDWKDPETINPNLNPATVILLNLANLFKVKSLLTFAIVGVYLALLLIPKEVPHLLETLVTMVVGFYFGSQFTKPTGGDKNG